MAKRKVSAEVRKARAAAKSAKRAEIMGKRSLLNKMQKLRRFSERENNGNVIVGYTADYAIYVHEDMKAKHKPGKQAKYLEQPARELQPELVRVVRDAMRNGSSLVKALLMAGLRIQRASQKIVPIEFGNLKGSAFTDEE